MKKQSLSWLALLLAVVLSVGFSSCDKDDDDENSSGGSIVGYWEFREVDDAGYVVEAYRFYADGTYDMEGSEVSYSGYSDSWGENGVYSLSGRTLTLVCHESSDGYVSGPLTYTVKIDGNKLTLTDEDGYEDVYYKK